MENSSLTRSEPSVKIRRPNGLPPLLRSRHLAAPCFPHRRARRSTTKLHRYTLDPNAQRATCNKEPGEHREGVLTRHRWPSGAGHGRVRFGGAVWFLARNSTSPRTRFHPKRQQIRSMSFVDHLWPQRGHRAVVVYQVDAGGEFTPLRAGWFPFGRRRKIEEEIWERLRPTLIRRGEGQNGCTARAYHRGSRFP